MPTETERIISYLRQHPEGVDDDDLALALNFAHRVQVNARCRSLERHGLIKRRQVQGKIRNFYISAD